MVAIGLSSSQDGSPVAGDRTVVADSPSAVDRAREAYRMKPHLAQRDPCLAIIAREIGPCGTSRDHRRPGLPGTKRHGGTIAGRPGACWHRPGQATIRGLRDDDASLVPGPCSRRPRRHREVRRETPTRKFPPTGCPPESASRGPSSFGPGPSIETRGRRPLHRLQTTRSARLGQSNTFHWPRTLPRPSEPAACALGMIVPRSRRRCRSSRS